MGDGVLTFSIYVVLVLALAMYISEFHRELNTGKSHTRGKQITESIATTNRPLPSPQSSAIRKIIRCVIINQPTITLHTRKQQNTSHIELPLPSSRIDDDN